MPKSKVACDRCGVKYAIRHFTWVGKEYICHNCRVKLELRETYKIPYPKTNETKEQSPK